ncbi:MULTISPECIES: tRNA lysidine(34) synthetase TilS [Helicobacter]|uniref:tRNA(Ile)-lysidine synthase n=1 Tax=Helicobacter ibis TaxID=2962633 RepID=A0ABT4VC32_9HELI|nr:MULTISPECIES: tRNA lysidine(34) synthetase TilS [Helicobacter]MDA3967041.1 tRNA lysidine(34) synthetase TilS [Helicobacter sp. WB40]MDA3968267.1 tRNA lysidine(34) synthetase TilS [Helicobacter ibis]
MIELKFLDELRDGKNLLAFSAGVDSTALYFLLKLYDISFDIAIVDYDIRKQSKLEVSRAKSLAFYDNKKCFVYESSAISSNFEHRAREIRYLFFQSIILEHDYTNLILAHQLNDSLEWFLMQFSKGTSVSNMIIMPKTQRKIQNKTYSILRPLLSVDRESLKGFLEDRDIFYFYDFSNNDFKFKRNYFRSKFSNIFLKEFKDGIKFSLSLLQENNMKIYNEIDVYDDVREYYIFSSCDLDFLYIDKFSKCLHYVLSKKQKIELNKYIYLDHFSLVFGDKIVVEKFHNRIYVFRQVSKKVVFTKQQKEYFRKNRIPIKFRKFLAYRYQIPIELQYIN